MKSKKTPNRDNPFPELLSDLIDVPFLRSVLLDFSLDLPSNYALTKNSYQIDTFEINDLSLRNLVLYVSSNYSRSQISFHIDKPELFHDSDLFLLNEHYTKQTSWISDTRRAKFYCYMLEDQFIHIHLSLQHPNGEVHVRFNSRRYEVKLKKEKNKTISGTLGVGVPNSVKDPRNTSRRATPDEIKKNRSKTNKTLHQLYHSEVEKLNLPIKNLVNLEFHNSDRTIFQIYISQEQLDHLKSSDKINEDSQIDLRADITWFDDTEVIIDQILSD